MRQGIVGVKRGDRGVDWNGGFGCGAEDRRCRVGYRRTWNREYGCGTRDSEVWNKG